jgi:hypothetical protein
MRLIISACVFFSLLLATGCGSDSPGGQSENQAIAGVIASVQEKSSHPTPAKALFVAVPEKNLLNRYAAMQFEMSGSPSVSGDSAKVSVKATDEAGADKGTKTWSLKKSASGWMIAEAPLP